MKSEPLNLGWASFINNNGTIEVELKKSKPDKLYKYYSLNNHSIEALEKRTIYFSHVNLLNDIMDGELNLLWDLKGFINIKKNDLKKIINIPKGKDEEQYLEHYLKNVTIPDFLRCRGVLSLTASYKNELIWVHYCNEKGFCLEINTSKFENFLDREKSKDNYLFFPISYPPKLKPIDFDKYILTTTIIDNYKKKQSVDAQLPIIFGLATKDQHWSYEDEWRILLKDRKFNAMSHPLNIINDREKEMENNFKSGGNLRIEQNIIEKIILAPLFFNNDRFNQRIEYKKNVVAYFFKNNDEGKLTQKFLAIIKDNFNDKIYMIDKKLNENKEIYRDINYKIDIIDIDSNYVKVIICSI